MQGKDEMVSKSEDVKNENGAEVSEGTCELQNSASVQRLPSADGIPVASSLWRVTKNGVVRTIIVPAKLLTCNRQSVQARTTPTMRRLAPKPPAACTVGPVAVQTGSTQVQQLPSQDSTSADLHCSDHRAAAATARDAASSSLTARSLASRRRCPCKSRKQKNEKIHNTFREKSGTEVRLPKQSMNTSSTSVAAAATSRLHLTDGKDGSSVVGDGPVNIGQSSTRPSPSSRHLPKQPCDSVLVESSTTSVSGSVASRPNDVTVDPAAASSNCELGQPTYKALTVNSGDSLAASVIIPSASKSLNESKTIASSVAGLKGLRNVHKKLAAKTGPHRTQSIAPRPASALIPRCPTETSEKNSNVAAVLPVQPRVVEVAAYQNAHVGSPLPSTGLLPAAAPCININCNNMIIIASPTDHVSGRHHYSNFSVFPQYGGSSLSEATRAAMSPASIGKILPLAGFDTTGYATQSGEVVVPSAVGMVRQRTTDGSRMFVKVAADITDSCLPTSVSVSANLFVVPNASQAAIAGSDSTTSSLFVCSPTNQSNSLGPIIITSPTNGNAATASPTGDTNRVLRNVVDFRQQACFPVSQQTVTLRPLEGAGTATAGMRPATLCGDPVVGSMTQKSTYECNVGSTHSVSIQPSVSHAAAPNNDAVASGTKQTASVAALRSRRRQWRRKPFFKMSKTRATGVADANSVVGGSKKVASGKRMTSQRRRARKLKIPLRTTQNFRPILPRPNPQPPQLASRNSADAALVSICFGERNLGGSIIGTAAGNQVPSLIHCVVDACLTESAKPSKVQTNKNPSTRTFKASKMTRSGVGSSSQHRKNRVLKRSFRPEIVRENLPSAVAVNALSEQLVNGKVSVKRKSARTRVYGKSSKQLTPHVNEEELCSGSKTVPRSQPLIRRSTRTMSRKSPPSSDDDCIVIGCSSGNPASAADHASLRPDPISGLHQLDNALTSSSVSKLPSKGYENVHKAAGLELDVRHAVVCSSLDEIHRTANAENASNEKRDNGVVRIVNATSNSGTPSASDVACHLPVGVFNSSRLHTFRLNNRQSARTRRLLLKHLRSE
jgi:hypothetical protein